MRNTGLGMTVAGLGATGIGLIVIFSGQSWHGIDPGEFIFLAGSATTAMGAPVLIMGCIQRAKVMKVIKNLQEKVSLRLGPTRLYFGPAGKGVGLTLKF